MKYFAFFILIFSFFGLSAQTYIVGEDTYETLNFSKLQNSDIQHFSGHYSFGFSEAESSLLILSSGGVKCAQYIDSEWSEATEGWNRRYINLTNVSIVNGKFSSDQLSGQFIQINDPELTRAAFLCISANEPVTYSKDEIGLKSDMTVSDFYVGKYPQASYRLLTESDLNTLSKSDLKFVRNEIFARYDYKFKPGGEMDTYFSAQSWYFPMFSDVDAFLTDIEKKNVELIKAFEAK